MPPLLHPSRSSLLQIFAPVILGVTLAAAEPSTDVLVPADAGSRGMSRVLDDLPAFLVDRLPLLDPDSVIQLSVRPHLGDFFHQDYVRVPVSLRWRVAPRLEIENEFGSYFARGGAQGSDYGLAGTALGIKWSPVPTTLVHDGISVGVDYRTPFNHAPRGFSDGYRHVQPYVAVTRILVPDWRLLGYANLGANFFQRTSLPSDFGRNQLHANSLALVLGLARDWSHVRASLTARLASTALTSDEGRQNFQLRPEVAFPLRRDGVRTQIMLTLGGRVMWGPNGRQVNTNGGVRINFHLDREHRQSPADDLTRFPL